MALTPSHMIPLGTQAPDFELTDVLSGKTQSLHELRSDKGTLIMFLCNHCPYVKGIQSGIVALARDYQAQGASIIAISSNDVDNYPEDSPEKMKELAQNLGYSFPYLYDESQEVAKSYQAACTPDFYLFDKDLKCVYRGQFDDSRPGNGLPVTGKSLRNAFDSLLCGDPISQQQTPSVGCNIKWKES